MFCYKFQSDILNILLRRAFSTVSSNKFQISRKPTLISSIQKARRSDPFKKEMRIKKINESGIDKNVHLNLSQLLDIRRGTARSIVTMHPHFQDNNFMNVVEQRVSYLEQKNVNRERIGKFIWLIFTPTEDLEKKTGEISSTLNLEFEEAVSLFKIAKFKWMEKTKNMWDLERKTEEEFTRPGCSYRHRVDFMADRLKCKPYEVTDMMAQHLGFSEQPFARVRETLRLLLDAAHMLPREIANNSGVLLLEVKRIEERIKILVEHNVPLINIGHLTKHQKEFDFFISTVVERVPYAEAHSDLVQFLQTQLNCDQVVATNLVSSVKLLGKIDHSVIERRIKLLQSQGLNHQDIIRVVSVLCASDSEIQENFARLKSINVPEENLLEFYRMVLKKRYHKDPQILTEADANEKYED